MKWHDFRMMMKPYHISMFHKDPSGDVDVDYSRVCQSIIDGVPSKKLVANTINALRTERKWIIEARPYYDLYPSIIEAFTAIDLEKVEGIHLKLPIDPLLIRLPVGHELVSEKGSKVRCIMAAHAYAGLYDENDPFAGRAIALRDRKAMLVTIDDGSIMKHEIVNLPVHTLNGITFGAGESIIDRLKNGWDHPYCDDAVDEDMVAKVYKIIATLCLLGDNPDLIEPEPTEKDRARWDATHDINLIEKARKNGKFGFAVGRHIEVQPGFRRPHFAIRWMGKGRVNPVVRPIKGCLVRKKVVTEVPKGFLDDEKAETDLS
jgi:hypothetical protein